MKNCHSGKEIATFTLIIRKGHDFWGERATDAKRLGLKDALMKIGIITFQRSHNYGAVLQAYALLTTLRGMGHSVELIDYWPRYRTSQYQLVSFSAKGIIKKSPWDSVKDLFKEFLSLPFRYRQHLKFKSFLKNSLDISSTSFHHGSDIPDSYEVIICGSDQIWRYNFRGNEGFDDVYFATYPSNKKVIKVSYAASMGDDDIDDNARKELSELIENLDFISVREDSLLQLIKPLTAKVPAIVVDPVFLLAEQEWRKIVRPNARKKRYLLFYQLLMDAEAAEIAKKIAWERGLEIIQVRGVNRRTNPFGLGRLKLSAGPVDFVSLVANAEYVVSTSYHGVLFSIIFQKPFSAIGFKSNVYRVKSLLKSLGLERRLLQKNSGNYTDPIDYNRVNDRLKEMVKSSLSFVRQIRGAAFQGNPRINSNKA